MNLLGGLADLDALARNLRKRVKVKPKPAKKRAPRRPSRGGWFVTLLPQEQQTYNNLAQMPGVSQAQVVDWLKMVQLSHAQPNLAINTNFLPSGQAITPTGGGSHAFITPEQTSTPQPVRPTRMAAPAMPDAGIPLVTPSGSVIPPGPDMQSYAVSAVPSQRLPSAVPMTDQPLQIAVPDMAAASAGGQVTITTPMVKAGGEITALPQPVGTTADNVVAAATAVGIPAMTLQSTTGPLAIINPCPASDNDPGVVRFIKLLAFMASVPEQIRLGAAGSMQTQAAPSPSGPSQRDIVRYLLDFGDMWRASEMAQNPVFDQDWGITPDMTTGLGDKGMSGPQTEKYSLALGLATEIGLTLKNIKDRHPEGFPEPTGDMAIFAAATKEGIAKGGFYVVSGEGAGENFINARLGAVGVRGLFQGALGPLKLEGDWGSVVPKSEAEATQVVAEITQNLTTLARNLGTISKGFMEVAAAMTTTAPVKLDAAANAQLKQDIMSQAQRNAADQTALDKVAAAAKATAIKWNKANAALSQRIGKYHEHFTSPQQKQQVLRKLKADAAVVSSYYRAINKFPGTIIEATRKRNALMRARPDLIIETAKGMQRNPAYDAWWTLLDKANNAWAAAAKSSSDAPIPISLASIKAIRQSKSVADLNKPKRQIELAAAIKHQKGKRVVEPSQYVEPRPLHALTHMDKVAAKLEAQAAAQEARRKADEAIVGAPGPSGPFGQLAPYPQVPTSPAGGFPQPTLPAMPLRKTDAEWFHTYPQLKYLDVGADTSGIAPNIQQFGPALPSTPMTWPPGFIVPTLQPGEMGPPAPFYPSGQADILSGLGRIGYMRRSHMQGLGARALSPRQKARRFDRLVRRGMSVEEAKRQVYGEPSQTPSVAPTVTEPAPVPTAQWVAAPAATKPAPVPTAQWVAAPAGTQWAAIPGVLVTYLPWIPQGTPMVESLFNADGQLKPGVTGTMYVQALGWKQRNYKPYTTDEALLFSNVAHMAGGDSLGGLL